MKYPQAAVRGLLGHCLCCPRCWVAPLFGLARSSRPLSLVLCRRRQLSQLSGDSTGSKHGTKDG